MASAPAKVATIPIALRASPGFLVGKAAQQAAELAEQALRPLELKARHYGVLVALHEFGPRSQHELGQALRIDRTTMVAIVDHLERLGFVQRGQHPADRRAHRVALTTTGQAALAQARGVMTQADVALVGRLSAADRARLVALLRRLTSS
jgi:DNA-binding MarR family transcriptional regulator